MNANHRHKTERQSEHKAAIRVRDRVYTVEEAVALAIRELQNGNARAAVIISDQILAEVPDHAGAHNYRGLALQQLGRHPDALASYDRAIALAPAYADAHLNRGNFLLMARRYGDALKTFDRVVALKPDSAVAYNSRGITLQEMNRYDEALASYDKALALQPDYDMAFSNKGLVLRQLQRSDDALACFDRALALQPDNARTHNNRGLLLQEMERHAEALASFDKALALQPGYAEAHNNRGIVLQELKRDAEALTSFDRALALNPDNATTHNNRGLALREMERFGEALASFDKAVALKPDYATALNNRGVTLNDLERYREALACLDQAIALRPDFAESHANRGCALKNLSQLEDALASCDRAVALKPGHAEAHDTRGTVLFKMGLYDDALASCDRAIALKPDYALAYENRGTVLVARGDMREAESMFRKALALKADLSAALNQLVAIRKYHDADHEDVRHLRSMLDVPGTSARNTKFLLFALGKVYDDCGRYDDAFECYRQANEICNARTSYDPTKAREITDDIIDVFTKEFLAGRFPFGSSSRSPLFVVGMPRSGTTLIASVLSNHRSVGTAGELPTIGDCIRDLPKLLEGEPPYPAAARRIVPAVASSLIGRYEKRLRRDAGPDVCHVVDKMPLNFLHLGFISMLFPDARIVHCTRHPMDTCLSNYFQHFSLRFGFSFDLRNVGHFYGEYARIMEHWRHALPAKMIEIAYEDMIGNTEQTVRATLDSLGLEWDDRCLAPHTNRSPVETASNWQVRQPIYDKSVQRWRHYEQHLTPLKEMLDLAHVRY